MCSVSLTLPPPVHSGLRPILNRLSSWTLWQRSKCVRPNIQNIFREPCFEGRKETNLLTKVQDEYAWLPCWLATHPCSHSGQYTTRSHLLTRPSTQTLRLLRRQKRVRGFLLGACPMPLSLSVLHVKRKRLQERCCKGSNSGRAKSQNTTFSSETG